MWDKRLDQSMSGGLYVLMAYSTITHREMSTAWTAARNERNAINTRRLTNIMNIHCTCGVTPLNGVTPYVCSAQFVTLTLTLINILATDFEIVLQFSNCGPISKLRCAIL